MWKPKLGMLRSLWPHNNLTLTIAVCSPGCDSKGFDLASWLGAPERLEFPKLHVAVPRSARRNKAAGLETGGL